LDDGLCGDLARNFFVFVLLHLEVIHLVVVGPANREGRVFAGCVTLKEQGSP
jgi:hypothetical protein